MTKTNITVLFVNITTEKGLKTDTFIAENTPFLMCFISIFASYLIKHRILT